MKTASTILLLIMAVSAVVAEQENADSIATYALGEVVVTAKGGAIVTSASIAEIGESAMRVMDVTNAAAALRGASPVFVSQNSRNESFFVLRGYDQRQIAVYLDGVPISVPYDGLVDLGMIPSGGLGKITVTKGMPSILYGANAMGGTINLVTGDRREGFAHHLRVQGGSTRSVSFSHGGSAAGLFWLAAGDYASSPGYPLPRTIPTSAHEDGGVRNNSQAEGYGGLLKLGTTLLPRSTAGLTVFHTQSSKGVPPSTSSIRPRYWKFPEWRKTLAYLTDQTAFGNALVVKGTVFFQKYRNVLDGYDDQTYSTQTRRYAFHSTYDADSYGATFSGTLISLPSHLTRLGLLFKNDIHREQDARNAAWERYEAHTITLGAEHEYALSRPLALVAGLSYDYLRPTHANNRPLRPNSGVWNGHVGVRFCPDPVLELRANAARRSRFPTLKELYSEVMGNNTANPGLSAERSWNGEIGCSLRGLEGLNISLAVFHSDIQQLILLTALGNGSQQFQNIGSARYQGVECEVKGEVGFGHFSCHYTYLNALNTQAPSEQSFLPYRPRHLLSGILSGTWMAAISLRAEFTYVADHYGVDMDTGTILRLRDYALLNARMGWLALDGLECFIRLENMLDRYYETEVGFPQAGRHIVIGLDADL